MPKLLLICVVDDDESVREALRDLLAGHDCRVSTFARADELLEFADLPAADCIVSDFHMPGKNGLELFGELRGRALSAPFVLMTAFASDRLREAALRAGVTMVLEKPFEPDEMLDCIRVACE